MDGPVAVDVGVVGLDDHVGSGSEEDGGGLAGVVLEEPDGGGDVVDEGVVRDGDGAVGHEEVDGASVVVGEGGGFGVEGGEGGGEGDEVVPDLPLGVLAVGEGGGPALGEGGREELLRVLGGRGRRKIGGGWWRSHGFFGGIF